MPAYNTQNPPPAIFLGYPMSQVVVFNAEALTTGEFSQQVNIGPSLTGGQRGIRVEIDFNANPGTFEIDIMESDTDKSGGAQYQQVPTGGQINTVTTGANGASTHQSSDLIPVAGQFVLLYVKTQPANGSITCTAKITRAA